ncbi:Dynein heavy chain 3 [Paramecium bursaria]
MNLNNFSQKGKNFETPVIKDISPSTQLMSMSNQDIDFYISVYGTDVKQKKYKEEAQFFLELVQPLLEENYKLKDTIINLTQALKLQKELVAKFIEQQEDLSDQSMNELLLLLKQRFLILERELQSKESINDQQQLEIKRLQNEIKELRSWQDKYIQDKEQELQAKIAYFLQRNEDLSTQNLINQNQMKELKEKMEYQENQAKATYEQNDQLNKQIQDARVKYFDVQKQLLNYERSALKEKNDIQRQHIEMIQAMKLESSKQIAELQQQNFIEMQELKEILNVREQRIQEIELSLTNQLQSIQQEFKRTLEQNKMMEQQLQQHKKTELHTLDSLGKHMMEKREKEQQLRQQQIQIDKLNQEIDDLKLQIFKSTKENEQYNLKLDQRMNIIKQQYKDKIQMKLQSQERCFNEERQKLLQELQDVQEDHKEEMKTLEIQKIALHQELQSENMKLRDAIEDLEFKMKDLDNQWDFKYAKLQMELSQNIRTQQSETKSRSLQSHSKCENRPESRFSKERYMKTEEARKIQPKLRLSQISEKKEVYQAPREQIIKNSGIDLQYIFQRQTYLPIEYFDDDTLQKYTDEDIIKMLEVGPLSCNIMEQSSLGQWFWYQAQIVGYGKLFKYKRVTQEGRCHRIHFVLDIEDIELYIKKLKKAIELRDYVDKCLKYSYYIENMPQNDLLNMSEQQIKRIDAKLTSFPLLMRKNEMEEAKKIYYYAQNKIIFNKFLMECDDQLPQKDLKDILKQQTKQKQKGLLFDQSNLYQCVYANGILESKVSSTFKEMRNQILQVSFLTFKPVIRCLNKISQLLIDLMEIDIFQYSTFNFEQFKYIQDQSIKNIVDVLKVQWTENVLKAISSELKIVNKKSNLLNQLQLDRFFQLIRVQIQDSLIEFSKKNCFKLLDYLECHMPEDVIINEAYQVQNIFVLKKKIQYFQQSQTPIFNLKLTAVTTDIQYSTNPFVLGQIIRIFFDKIFNELQYLPDPEPTLLDNYFKFNSLGYIKAPSKQTDWYQEIDSRIEKISIQIKKTLSDYIIKHDEFRQGLSINVVSIEESQRSIEKHIDIINQIYDSIQKVMDLPLSVQVGFFLINLEDLRESLLYIFQQKNNLLQDELARFYRTMNIRLIIEFNSMFKKMTKVPKSIEKLVEKKEYLLTQIPYECEQKFVEIETCNLSYYYLEELKYQLRRDDITNYFKLKGMKAKTDQLIEQQLQNLEQQKLDLQLQQKVQQIELNDRIKNLSFMLHELTKISEYSQLDKAISDMNHIQKTIEDFKQQALQFNKREELFGVEITKYQNLTKIANDFVPFQYLWTVCKIWKDQKDTWTNGKIQDIDAQQCEQFVTDQYRMLVQSISLLTDHHETLKLAIDLKKQIDEFKPKVPLISSLKRQGMQQRHYDEISTMIQQPISLDQSLQEILDLGMMRYTNYIVDIAYRAQQEYNIEMMINNISQKWSTLQFNVTQYKNTTIFRKIDETQQIIDDHMIQLQAMLQSKYNDPFKVQLVQWYNNLKQISNFVEEFVKFQRNWMYFYPIFESYDISKQLPIEYKKFRTVDKQFKELVNFSHQVYKFGTQNTDKILESNVKLEQIHKELNNYLEKKREKFLRLYFISNDDLLEILSKVQDAKEIQPYLNKLFQSINKITLQNQYIQCICSDDETIKLQDQINPYGKNIEDWLMILEVGMQETIKKEILKDSSQLNQSLIIQYQIKLTNLIETKQDISYLIQQDLLKLIQSQQSLKINSLIIVTVYYRDLVMKLKDQQYLNDFVLKFYTQETKVMIKCFQYVNEYGYEYIGPSQRLVITPLTEKCFVGFLNALQLKKSGAAIGPTGTGKSETIKEMAKQAGKFCIVFNCSPLMDFIMIGKYLKGLAGSGQWCCLDEFNRINVDVLSVVAAQLQQLKVQSLLSKAIVQTKNFGLFATMNPFYVGRNNLPDNLKAQFRYVILQIPDMQQILEVLLYSYGYKNGNEIAKQILLVFKLCKDLLSSQIYYDFSLRAIKSVLLQALQSEEKSTVTIIKALEDSFFPKLQQNDSIIFKYILKDIFNQVNHEEQKYVDLLNYYPSQELKEKSSQLLQSVKCRTGTIILGNPGSGKSTCIDVILQTLKMTISYIYPKAMSLGDLFGQLNLQTSEWTDGLLPQLIQPDSILLFDGPVEQKWIESLNTVLDDSKRLCLTNGQIIKIPENLKVFFEFDCLDQATPATISRCSLVYINDTTNAKLLQFVQQQYTNKFGRQVIDHFERLYQWCPINYTNQYINLLSLFPKIESDMVIAFCLAWTFIPQVDVMKKKEIDTYLKNTFQIQLVDAITNYQFVDQNFRIYEVPQIPINLKYHEIIVPTRQNQALITQSQNLLVQLKHIILSGQSGVGKSLLSYQIIQGFEFIKLTYSCHMDSVSTQKMIESKLDKRRKGVYGPQIGNKLVIMLDDLHYPKETEIIRQYVNHGGWYSKNSFISLEDTVILSTLNFKNTVSQRLLRSFNNFNMIQEDQIVERIFTILTGYFNVPRVVPQILQVFQQIRQKLLPTPRKIHYQFTLRDISRVVQNLCVFKTQNDNQLPYELARVISDRLLKALIGIDNHLFCEFASADKQYKQVQTVDVKDLFIQYKMPVYDIAIKKLIYIVRAIRLAEGHVVLVGTVGAGKTKLARMAAHINQYHNPLVDRWRDDLKQGLMNVINQEQSLCLIINELTEPMQAFQDVSTLINSGDIELFNKMEQEELWRKCRIEAQLKNSDANNLHVHQEYLQRIKRNFHAVICLSTQTNKFREYPSFVSCTTIIWFEQLPEQALQSIAYQQLLDNQLAITFRTINQSVEIAAKLYEEEQNKKTHFTQLHYLQMIDLFQKINSEQTQMLQNQFEKIETGLSQLRQANEEITNLQNELEDMAPEIERARQETAAMTLRITKEKEDADSKEIIFLKDEQEAQIQQLEATKLAEEAERSVEEVNSQLELTLQEVQKLKKEHLVEIKSLGKPPKPVIVILSGVVILNLDNLKQKGGEIAIKQVEGKKEEDYFETAKRYFLNDPKELLEILRVYDKNNINPIHIQRLEKQVLFDPEFSMERAKQCSAAVKHLYSWVKAMYDYNRVYIDTKPLRERLQASQEQLQEKTQILNEKKQQLIHVQEIVKRLQLQLREKVELQQQLTQQTQECEQKLKRAQQLTKGLSNEQSRWRDQIQSIKSSLQTVKQDSAIQSAFITYCGPFTQTYRKQLLFQWKNPKNLISDNYTQQNEFILSKSQQYVLCIDPQLQASKIIKKYENIYLMSGFDQKLFDNLIQLRQAIFMENINIIPRLPFIQGQKIYLTTMHPNPKINMDLFAKLCIVNFTITQEGLEDLMLDFIISLENPNLQSQTQQYIQQSNDNKQKLHQIEESILSTLGNTKITDLLNDDTLINQLSYSKILVNELLKSQEEMKLTHEFILDSRNQYFRLAKKSSQIFFVIQKLQYLQYLYQFSLEFFQETFSNSLRSTIANSDIELKSDNVYNRFICEIYIKVAGSLFEKDQLIFSFLLAFQEINLNNSDWKYLVQQTYPNQNFDKQFYWIDDYQKDIIYSRLLCLKTHLAKSILENFDCIRDFYLDCGQIPSFNTQSDLQQINLVKAIKPEKLKQFIKEKIALRLTYYLEPFDNIFQKNQRQNLESMFAEAKRLLIVIVQPNQNALERIKVFAKSKNFQKKWLTVSMGQGQGPKAEKAIKEAADEGLWVILQNCHIAQTWMNELDKLSKIEGHENFRIWLTTQPTDIIPARIIQQSTKLIFYSEDTATNIDEKQQGLNNILQQFHQHMNLRIKLGKLGFNYVYDLNQEDHNITKGQLNVLSDLNGLKFIICELHYGGKMLDQNDLLILKECLDYIIEHPNVEIFTQNAQQYLKYQETYQIIQDLNLLNVQLIQETEMQESQIDEIQVQIPQLIDYQQVYLTNPIRYEDSLNNLLLQEVSRLNGLLDFVSQNLQLARRQLQGDESINEDQTIDDLKNQRVPSQWIQRGFMFNKPLGSWLDSLNNRHKYLINWSQKQHLVTQLGMLMSPKSFFSSSQLNYCRLNKVKYTDAKEIHIIRDQLETINERPKNGHYLTGIYIQGAQWNNNTHELDDCTQEFNNFPVIYINYDSEPVEHFLCPLYQTTDRKDDKNFINYLQMPSKSQIWKLRGVAAFTNI